MLIVLILLVIGLFIEARINHGLSKKVADLRNRYEELEKEIDKLRVKNAIAKRYITLIEKVKSGNNRGFNVYVIDSSVFSEDTVIRTKR